MYVILIMNKMPSVIITRLFSRYAATGLETDIFFMNDQELCTAGVEKRTAKTLTTIVSPVKVKNLI